MATGCPNISSWADIEQVTAGYYYTVGLKSDGTVVAVGFNQEGQLNVDSWNNIKEVINGLEQEAHLLLALMDLIQKVLEWVKKKIVIIRP